MAWLAEHLDPTKLESLLSEIRHGRLTHYNDLTHGNEHYAAWLFLVDRWLIRRLGITHADLADYQWIDDFCSDTSPMQAGRDALEREELGWLP